MLLTAFAADPVIHVGGTPITVPIPEGFAVVTPEMNALDTFLESIVPHTNQRLLSLVPEEIAEASTDSQFENLERMLGIQIPRRALPDTVSSDEFVKIKKHVTTDNSKTFAQLQKKLGNITEEISGNLEENFSGRVDLKIGEIVLLPVHHETDRIVSYTILSKTSVTTEGEIEPIENATATTVTMVHVKARIVFLYVVGKDTDLNWTRKVAREWSDAIVKLNPSDVETAKIEATPARNRGVDSGLRGGVVGGMAAALVALLMRSFKSNDQWLSAKSDDEWFG